MKKLILVLCLALAMVISGCGLKRSNPLDPNADAAIIVPEQVSDLEALPSPANVPNKYVRLSWRANSSLTTDGYYVYRGLSYFSEFARVDTVITVSSYDHINIMPGDYYYKVSAFKTHPAGRLEGRLSAPVFVRVPN
ncbi:MAG: hypothetical protein U1C33_07805 [Candidatus Cloacimonadaceae bacterium]|nr:hypothetical protein [Candidatus Cloacimonadaceae bacterium]